MGNVSVFNSTVNFMPAKLNNTAALQFFFQFIILPPPRMSRALQSFVKQQRRVREKVYDFQLVFMSKAVSHNACGDFLSIHPSTNTETSTLNQSLSKVTFRLHFTAKSLPPQLTLPLNRLMPAHTNCFENKYSSESVCHCNHSIVEDSILDLIIIRDLFLLRRRPLLGDIRDMPFIHFGCNKETVIVFIVNIASCCCLFLLNLEPRARENVAC